MLPLKVLLSTTTALLLINGCAIRVVDEQICSPIPGDLGAVCDNFLTSNQQILTQDAWVNLQATWASQGYATECTTSQTIGDIKEEIEKLCSVAKCDYDTKQKIVTGLKKIEKLGK